MHSNSKQSNSSKGKPKKKVEPAKNAMTLKAGFFFWGRNVQGGMRQRVAQLSQTDVERLVETDENVVMRAEYTYHEPWDVARVRRCVRTLRETTRASHDDADAIRACVVADDELRAFRDTHPTIFKCVTCPDLVRLDGAMSALDRMLTLRDSVARGTTSSECANDAIAEAALAQGMHRSSRAGQP